MSFALNNAKTFLEGLQEATSDIKTNFEAKRESKDSKGMIVEDELQAIMWPILYGAWPRSVHS